MDTLQATASTETITDPLSDDSVTPSSSFSSKSKRELPEHLVPLHMAICLNPLSIHRISLDSCRLKTADAIVLVQAIRRSAHISHLRLINRVFKDPKGVLPVLFDSTVPNLNLESLELSNNSISGLPEDFGAAFPALKTLILRNNRLATLPDSIGRMTELTALNISSNKLIGLPDSLNDLVHLQRLRLHSNRFTILPKEKGEPGHMYLTRLFAEWRVIEPKTDRRSSLSRMKLRIKVSPRGHRLVPPIRCVGNVNPLFTLKPLAITDLSGPDNVYVEIAYGDQKYTTPIQHATTAPTWNVHPFLFYETCNSEEKCVVTARAVDFVANIHRVVGSVEFARAELLHPSTGQYQLMKRHGKVVGTISLTVAADWTTYESNDSFSFEKNHATEPFESVVAGCSLPALLKYVVEHPSSPIMRMFLLSFFNITRPFEFIQTLRTLLDKNVISSDDLGNFFEILLAPNMIDYYLPIVLGASSIDTITNLFPLLPKNGNRLADLYAERQYQLASYEELFIAPKKSRSLIASRSDRTIEQIPGNVLAEQLTLIDYDCFSRIKICEYLPYAKGHKDRAPNLSACIDRANAVTQWLIGEISFTKNVKIRTDLLTKCVEMGETYLRLNNFQGLMSVVLTLNSSPVARMKKTYQGLDTAMSARFQYLERLLSPIDNYRQYREYVIGLSAPGIPHLGVILGDLTFILEGNADTLPRMSPRASPRNSPRSSSAGMINWAKAYMIGHNLASVQRFLAGAFDITPDSALAAHLHNLPIYTEDSCYRMSKTVEPPNTM